MRICRVPGLAGQASKRQNISNESWDSCTSAEGKMTRGSILNYAFFFSVLTSIGCFGVGTALFCSPPTIHSLAVALNPKTPKNPKPLQTLNPYKP